MKSNLLIVVLFAGLIHANAQCPQNSQITSSGKCIRLSYTTPPIPLPAFIVYLGVQFNFLSGLGTVGSPAEYKDPAATGACSSYSGANANITLPNGTVCTYNGGVLPVSFIAIEGAINNLNNTVINWKVQEILVDRYDVEKSKDGINFLSVGVIASKGDGLNNYSFEVTARQEENSYYRIKQVDKDGRKGYSIIIKVSSHLNKNHITIYPNPATDMLAITSGAGLINTIATLSDVNGRDIKQLVIKTQTITVDISQIPRGVYVLRFVNGITHKFIKQ